MKTEIETALQPLVGLPFWGAGRVVDMEWLQFGRRHVVDSRRGTKTVGDWAIHISCAWRIRESAQIIVASSDLYMRADHLLDSTEKFNWDVQENNQRDQKTKRFLSDKEDSLVVEQISADDIGGFTLNLSSGFYFEAFPDVTSGDFEHWRIFQPHIQGSSHFVVTTSGIENQEVI